MAKLLYEIKDGIGWIRFNRPEVLNAFDPEEARRLVQVLKQASDDKAVKAIIISSVGDAFCAGDDLKVALEEYPLIKSGKIHPILDIVEDITESLQEIPRIIRSAPKITISAVRGYAVGGGFEIAIDSDLIVAAQNAIFGFPEVTAGMTITGGVTKLLPMIVGLNKAREFVATRYGEEAEKELISQLETKHDIEIVEPDATIESDLEVPIAAGAGTPAGGA